MKTRELILALQKADPNGELEVVVGNEPIFFLTNDPAYWDGTLQKLILDNTCHFYNVVGAVYCRVGAKIQIHTHSITDALWKNPDLQVRYEGYMCEERHRDNVERTRIEAKRVIKEIKEDLENIRG